MESVDGRKGGLSAVPNDATGHMQLLEHVAALWSSMVRRWRQVATVVGIMLALGMAYLMITPAQFSASALVLINSKNFSGQRDNQSGYTDMAALSANIESQVEILKSERILRKVVDSEDMAKTPLLQPGPFRGALTRFLAIVRKQSEEERDLRRTLNAMRALQASARIKRIPNTYLVEIDVTLPDGQSAARIANSYARIYVEDQRKLREDLLRESSDALGARAKELREQARLAEEAVEKFKFFSAAQNNDASDSRVALKDLESQARTFRIIHDKFLERYADVLQQQQSVVPDSQLLSIAMPPLSKRWPNTILVLMSAAVLGVLLSALWVLWLDSFGPVEQSRQDEAGFPWSDPQPGHAEGRSARLGISGMSTPRQRRPQAASSDGEAAQSRTFGSQVLLDRLRRVQERMRK